jgi:hypothetical protein
MDRAFSTHGYEIITENLKRKEEKAAMGDLAVCGKIINRILRKEGVRFWSGFIWLRKCMALVNTVMNLRIT